MEASGEASVTGVLSFDSEDGNEVVGKSRNIFPDGSETTITLSSIFFTSNGKVMEGTWMTDNVQSLHGNFRFSMDGPDRFEGYYTVGNQDGKYYWRGTK
jgi:hypothetical protein